jgi:hypothetical protein
VQQCRPARGQWAGRTGCPLRTATEPALSSAKPVRADVWVSGPNPYRPGGGSLEPTSETQGDANGMETPRT